MHDLAAVQVKGASGYAVLALAVLITLALGWIAVSQQLGSLLIDRTSATSPNAAEIARLSLNLSPQDPEVNNFFAATRDDPNGSLEWNAMAVRLAPNDHRWRVALGRAYEQAGQLEAAEAEFRMAATLAPTYTYPRWHLGNFYLRQEREELAIEEFRKASVGHFDFREQVFGLAWDYYGGDAAQAERMVSDEPETLAYFARFLAWKGAGSESLRVWNRLTDNDKQKYKAVGRWTVQELLQKHRYTPALEISRQVGETNAEPETVSDPSFEEGLKEAEEIRFGWAFRSGEPRVDIALDPRVQHTGNRSLRLSFRNYAKPNFSDVFQNIVVEPGKNYLLDFWVRTEALKSTGRPMLQAVSSCDNASLATSDAFPADTADWTRIGINFRNAPECDAVSIRIIRPYCGEECPITGTVWLDDFALVRVR